MLLSQFYGNSTFKKLVVSSLKNRSYYSPSNSIEIFHYLVSPKSFICGAWLDNKLVGFSSVRCGFRNYIIEDTVVAPKYRGNKLQYKMWSYIIERLPYPTTLWCTIHPQNTYSLNNALSLDFCVTDMKVMYHREIRYILKRSLKNTFQ